MLPTTDTQPPPPHNVTHLRYLILAKHLTRQREYIHQISACIKIVEYFEILIIPLIYYLCKRHIIGTMYYR